MDQRRALADFFGLPALQVKVANGEVRVGVAGTPRDGQVLPLSPNRFVSSDVDGLQVEFHRDARGQAGVITVMQGEARARYFRTLRIVK